jgi:hypothetical protein
MRYNFHTTAGSVIAVDAEEVVLNWSKLENRLRRAIGHAHEGEAPRI